MIEYFYKLLDNLLSYKLWVLGVATWLVLRGTVDGVAWVGLAVAIIGGRVVEYKWGGK